MQTKEKNKLDVNIEYITRGKKSVVSLYTLYNNIIYLCRVHNICVRHDARDTSTVHCGNGKRRLAAAAAIVRSTGKDDTDRIY